MELFNKFKNFLRGNKGIGEIEPIQNQESQENHELNLDDIQTTFNDDSIDVLVEDGEVENVSNEN